MANKRGSTAYAPEDVEDAERGAPAVSLEGWATGRGLEYLGSALAEAFVTVLPRGWTTWSTSVAARAPAAPRLGRHRGPALKTFRDLGLADL